MEGCKVCFLDRDGVIIVEKNYLSKPEDVELIEGVVDALRILQSLNFTLIVVSNQSGVARGYFSENDVMKVHEHLIKQLAQEKIQIKDIFYCPHHPKGIAPYNINCGCRKPEIGMFTQAIEKYNIDITQSIMIGDKISDILAGKKAGCCWEGMVLTGHGFEEKSEAERMRIPLFENLFDAAQWLQHNSSE